MKTSTGRILSIAPLLTLLLAGSALTVGNTTVPPSTTPQSTRCSRIKNATLANNVRDELAKTMSPRVMGGIKVTAKNRVVTLSGTVNFIGTSDQAVRLARKVRCVTRVVNRIKFQGPFEACVGGQQNCCCPNEGCECMQICPTCPPTPRL